jgi:membrane protease subunit HflC
MNRQRINLAVGIMLMLLFLVLLVFFQVRQTELAIVTTFNKVTRTINEPGLQLKWPWPIQKVHYLDRRIQNFESKLDETQTSDGRNLLVSVYAGWVVADPDKFFVNFPGNTVSEAAKRLDEMIRSKKNEAVGQHPFGHFISTDPQQLKFNEVETEILAKVAKEARAIYGVEVKFIRIKRLGLPESVTQEVFNVMKSERQRLVNQLRKEGDAKATEIRTAADRDREKLLAEADREASLIRAQGDLKAAEAFQVFQKKPELAILLLKLKALEQSLQERATLVLDQQTPPFDLLRDTNAPLSLR